MPETMEDVALEALEVSFDAPAIATAPAPPGDDDKVDEAVNLGMTIPQPESGALRPTLIIGVGSFGRKALVELRCRFLDRFGDHKKLALVRFLCIDPDPQAVNLAVRRAPDVGLSRNEV